MGNVWKLINKKEIIEDNYRRIVEHLSHDLYDEQITRTYSVHNDKEEISTNIYYLRKLFSDNFSVTPTPENQFSILEEDFMRLFTNLLSEIFDENIPFAQTKCKTHCNYCPFKQICQ